MGVRQTQTGQNIMTSNQSVKILFQFNLTVDMMLWGESEDCFSLLGVELFRAESSLSPDPHV